MKNFFVKLYDFLIEVSEARAKAVKKYHHWY